MIESNRQFAIFGNFNAINFDNLNLFDDFKEKYKLNLSALTEIPEPINQPQQPSIINFSTGPAISRPCFKSSDNNIIIFLGSSRINIEQKEQSVETYDVFNFFALEFLKILKEKFEININRLAINGQLATDKLDLVKPNTFFKPSKVYSETPDEWNFKTNSKELDKSLNCMLNKIANYGRGIYVNSSNEVKEMLIISYDINTCIDTTKDFSYEDILTFNKIGVTYRNYFLN